MIFAIGFFLFIFGLVWGLVTDFSDKSPSAVVAVIGILMMLVSLFLLAWKHLP